MTKSRFRQAALVFFGILVAALLYRAATQSIAFDEALAWKMYLAGPATEIFETYDPNNHFLAILLFKISTSLFGNSELAIRLPTVLAGAWFFWTVFRLCGLLLGEGWLFLLGCAVLSLNPILLDFFVAARGYGLAVACLFWTLYEMVAWWKERADGANRTELRKRLWKAGIGCAAAVMANLVLVMPIFVLGTAFAVLLWREKAADAPAVHVVVGAAHKKSKKAKPSVAPQKTKPTHPWFDFLLPMAILAIFFLIASPIVKARASQMSQGSRTALASLHNLMEVSFHYGDASFLQGVEHLWTRLALFFIPLVVLLALCVASIRPRAAPSLTVIATLWASAAVVGSAILLVLAHLLGGVLYPINRTGIYFLPLATLAALGLARILGERSGPSRWAANAISVVLLSFAVEFAAQWNVSSFLVWHRDADSRTIFQRIESAPRPANVGPEQIRLGSSWTLDESLNYYRVVQNAYWMAPLLREDGFDGPRDFYVISPEDQGIAKLPPMNQIYKGPVSGTVLAVPAKK